MIRSLHSFDDFATITLAFMPPEKHCSKRVGSTKSFGGIQRRSAAAQPSTSEIPLSSGKINVQHSAQNSAPISVAAKKKPIPAKYTSQDACEKTTGNCTGHGDCKIIARELGENEKTVELFGCVCNKPDIRKNKDGSTKTTYFGGTACQKKDLVAPFWLLAGTTVFLLTILSMGIGLLYSMGSEELPSVIGAGVSGPRAK